MIEIHQQPYWNSTMQLVQDDNTVHLQDEDIVKIVAERYNLQDFNVDDLVKALQEYSGTKTNRSRPKKS